MKQKNTWRGFTLIELLVVVLIIGILAAIALPQYQKAVLKARLVQNVLWIKTLEKSVDLYVLQNGLPEEWDFWDSNQSSWEALEIPLPCTDYSSDGCVLPSDGNSPRSIIIRPDHPTIEFTQGVYPNSYKLTSIKNQNGRWVHSCSMDQGVSFDYCDLLPTGWK